MIEKLIKDGLNVEMIATSKLIMLNDIFKEKTICDFCDNNTTHIILQTVFSVTNQTHLYPNIHVL